MCIRDSVGLVRCEPFVAGIIFQGGGVKDDFAGQKFFEPLENFYFCRSHCAGVSRNSFTSLASASGTWTRIMVAVDMPPSQEETFSLARNG